MLPFIYDFKWDAGHIIFLGIFFTVVAIVITTVLAALRRSAHHMNSRQVDELKWKVDFEDLPKSAQVCRHELTGEFKHRTCPNSFDCRRCETHAKLELARTARGTAAAAEETVFGLRMPADRWYHRGHTWARREEDGTFTVGIDDFGSRLIGVPDAVELPNVGETVHAYGTAWKLRRGSREARMLAPIDGVVVETGDADKGWYLRLQPLEAEPKLTHLLHGGEVQPWIMKELERVELAISGPTAGPSLADGGELVKDLPAGFPSADWDSVWGAAFLEP